jgi:hypothetical protein
MIVAFGFLSSLGKIIFSTAFCLVDLSVLLLVRSYPNIWQNMLKNKRRLDTSFILKQQWTDRAPMIYKGEYILVLVDWGMRFILLIKKLCINENILEFIKGMCVSAQFCGKWIYDEMMDILMKERGETSCMGHRIKYLITLIYCSVCLLVPFEQIFVTVFLSCTNKASSFMLFHVYLCNIWPF